MPYSIAAGAQQQQGGVAQSGSVPSPTGGLNTRDSLATMPENDAVALDNWFPDVGSVDTRLGYTSYATGLLTNVETLVEFHAGATHQFFAAAGGNIYNTSVSGAVGAAVVTGMSNARWQTVNADAHLIMVNGQDDPRLYDGTTWSTTSFTGSGLTQNTLYGVNFFKHRMYFWQQNSQDFWYGDTDAIVSGTLTKFPLSLVTKLGGNLVFMATWTRDGGDGPDDYAVFFMSSGETIVYQGSDPGDIDDWSLVGRYYLLEPLSVRGFTQYGGDVYIMTKGDFVSLTDLLAIVGTSSGVSKLSGAAAEVSATYGANYGWEAVLYSGGNRILFNVPVSTNNEYWQYGINTITKAPFRFLGMNARCFGIYKGDLYFGENGKVFKANDGFDDNGAAISVSGTQSFNALGNLSQKRFTKVRPVVNADGNVTLNMALAFDYGDVGIAQNASSESEGVAWDTAFFDTEFWSPESRKRTDVYGASGKGIAVSLKLGAILMGQQINWFRTDYQYKPLSKFN